MLNSTQFMNLDANSPAPWQCFRRSTPEDRPRSTTQQEEQTRNRRRRIRCPRCNWEPRRKDLWGCLCGHAWNTFDTGGRCPHCLHVWTRTQCLHCHQWSRHEDWYE